LLWFGAVISSHLPLPSYVSRPAEVYVSDFGLARVKESEEEAGTTKQTFGPVGVCIFVDADLNIEAVPQHDSGWSNLSVFAHGQWMAPEALQSRQYSEGTDAFSFGVMLWYATSLALDS
jgi:serine/threonine protein kinase